MINNHSGNHYNSTMTRSSGGAVSRSGARLLLHTAAALSLAGPRRAASGERSKRRTAVQVQDRAALPVISMRQRTRTGHHTAVRVRESAGSTQSRADAGQDLLAGVAAQSVNKKAVNKKAGKGVRQKQHRPAGGRTGSTAAAGSRGRQRRAELPDGLRLACSRAARALADVESERAGRSRRHTASCASAAIPLGEKNFTRILEDPSGCYRLVEDVVLGQEQSLGFPLGNHSRAFNGTLDGAGYHLSLNLTRQQGDAVLFGYVEHSRIDIAVTHSHLVTHNGSRAALIGELGDHNQITLSRLENSRFQATGEGSVEAALIASTRGAGNRLDLYHARSNRVEARAFPASAGCIDADACQHKAAASLGLGVLRLSPWNQRGKRQTIAQHYLEDNRLQAWAGYKADDRAGNGSRAEASAGLLGILGDAATSDPRLNGWQRELRNNQVQAYAEDQPGTSDEPGVGGHSCASLGYGTVRCALTSSVASSEACSAGEWLWLSQTACLNNSVQAWSGPSPWSSSNETGQAQGGIARATLASVDPLRFLYVRHDAVGPGQLQALAHAGVAERALLAPTREAWVLLYAGGDAGLPLLAPWDGAINQCTHHSLFDTAGYQVGDFNCNSNITRTRISSLRHSSLTFGGWREAHHSLHVSEFSYFAFKHSPCYDHDSALHYPHETLQALTESASGWLLVTRQRYPGRPENDQHGLMRVTRYRTPDRSWPQTQARARHGGVILYQASRQDPLLQDGRPVANLVQRNRLYQLYQGAGESAQLIGMALNNYNSDYRLTHYDALAGQARLLSVEDGELHLWTQGANDTVLAYGLGQELLTNGSSWLHWGFDLSDQPGNHTLLARAGDWLYSLRQADGQPASLRRRHVTTGELDSRWQPAWPGNVTDNLHLVVAYDHLTAVPPGALAEPGAPALGFQARVPDTGGCLQWSQIALAHIPLPADSVMVTTQASPPTPYTGTAPGVAAGNGEAARRPSGAIGFGTVGIAAGVSVGVGAGLVALWTACVCLAPKLCRAARARAAQDIALRALGGRAEAPPPISCSLSEETAV